jgi:hypothetical protein
MDAAGARQKAWQPGATAQPAQYYAGWLDSRLVIDAINAAQFSKILPFQFVAAWRNAPQYAREIEDAMLRSLSGFEALPGRTILLVDVSGSMVDRLSRKSDMTRTDAAAVTAVGYAAVCQHCEIYTFSNSVVAVPATRGFGLVDSIARSQSHGGTYLARALTQLKPHIASADRLIVITDEQAHPGAMPDLGSIRRKYMVNVAPYHVGVAADHSWTSISGFSLSLIPWMIQEEKDNLFTAND